jgi:nicotinamide mononucleotide transporter
MKVTKKIRQYFDDWTIFEEVWLIVFSTVAFIAYFATGGTLASLLASWTGMITVVLVAKGRISNYYFGVVNVAIYGFLAFQSQFYGEVMLNWGYYLPLQFIGYYIWTKNQNQEGIDEVNVARLSNRRRIMWICISIVSIFGYGLFLKYLNGNLPFFDSTSTTLSVIAQYLMIRRVKEQWIVWMIINIVSIYMWADIYLSTGNSIAILIMWIAYLVNSIYGWYNWRLLESKQDRNEVIDEFNLQIIIDQINKVVK